jgi:alpha-amylase/alpha-mannosidase (GH57 family)
MMSFLKLHNQMQNDKLWKLRQDYLKEMKESSFFDLNTKTSSNAIKLKAPKMDKILYSNKKTTLIKDLIDTRYESMPKRKTVISVQDAAGVSKRPKSTPSGKKTSSITTYNAASTYGKPVELDWFAPKF